MEDSSILKRLLVSLPGAALNKSHGGLKHPGNPGPQFVGCFNEATVSSGFFMTKTAMRIDSHLLFSSVMHYSRRCVIAEGVLCMFREGCLVCVCSLHYVVGNHLSQV